MTTWEQLSILKIFKQRRLKYYFSYISIRLENNSLPEGEIISYWTNSLLLIQVKNLINHEFILIFNKYPLIIKKNI